MSLHPPHANILLSAKPPGSARTSPVLHYGLYCAALFGVLVLCAGIVWRTSGSAPVCTELLEGVDIALWLAALLLVPRFEQNISRMLIHNPPLRVRMQLGLTGASELAESGLAIGLAALGALVAYPAGEKFAQLESTEGISQTVPFAAYLVFILLLAAPAILTFSGALLFTARRLAGYGYGTLLWGAAALAMHAPLLGARMHEGIYTTLGGYSTWLLNLLDSLANQSYPSMYLGDIVWRVLFGPVLLSVAALALLAGFLLRPSGRCATMPVAWSAAVISIGAVAVYSLFQTWVWAGDPAVRYPGSYATLAGCGLTVALVLRLLCCWADGQPAGSGRFNREMLWLTLTGLSWLILTDSAVRAGEAAQATILVYCLACVLLLICGAVLIEWISRISLAAAWLAAPLRIAFLLILVVPFGPQMQPLARWMPAFLARAVFIYEEMVASSLFALCFAALAAFAWLSLYPVKARRTREAAKDSAAG